jgi:hypothetical protein
VEERFRPAPLFVRHKSLELTRKLWGIGMAKSLKTPIRPQSPEPFFKTNAFWGMFGGGIGILAGVVAVTSAIHWLVFGSWILLTGALWCGLGGVSEKVRTLLAVAGSIVLAIALFKFDAKFVPDAPATLHTHIDVLTPSPVTGDPYFPFHAGQKPSVAIQYMNVGDHAADETYFGLGISVCRNPLSFEEEPQVWKSSTLHKAVAAGGVLMPHGPSHYNTITAADTLTSDQVIGLNNGFLALCATARIIWRDTTGSYCRYSFQSFHREPIEQATQAFFNWHVQGSAYNKEETCEYGTGPPSIWKRWLSF